MIEEFDTGQKISVIIVFLIVIYFLFLAAINFVLEKPEIRIQLEDCNKIYAGYCGKDCKIGEWETLTLCQEWLNKNKGG